MNRLIEFANEFVTYRQIYIDMNNSPRERQMALIKASILVSMLCASPDNLDFLRDSIEAMIFFSRTQNLLDNVVNKSINLSHGEMITYDKHWNLLYKHMINKGSSVIKNIYNKTKEYTNLGNQMHILPLLYSIVSEKPRGNCIDKAIWNLYKIIGSQNKSTDPLDREVLKIWPSHYEISPVRQIQKYNYGAVLERPVMLEVNSQDIFNILTTASIHRHIKGTTKELKIKNDILCTFYNLIMENQNKNKMKRRTARNFTNESYKNLYPSNRVITRRMKLNTK
jgi:hypothetical protein